jgi:hypothetical protein
MGGTLRPAADVHTLTQRRLGPGHIEVALPEVERNFIERALFPLFRFCKPEDLALDIQHSTLPAEQFLVSNFDEPLHELHSLGVKPISRNNNRVWTDNP